MLEMLYEFYKTNDHDRYPPFTDLIPSSTTFYVHAAIKARTGISVPYKSLEKLLKSEGLLPAVEYDIPFWYIEKYRLP